MFIRFVIATSYASKIQLGYDKTIKRVDVNGHTRYKIKANGKWWVTLKDLSSIRALRVMSRGTRVWEVCPWDMRLHQNPPTKVIKDFWLDRDAESEEAIQTKIFNMFNKVNDVGDISDAKDYFMSIEKDEVVRQDNTDDTTEDLDCYEMFYLEDPKAAAQAEALQRGTVTPITGHSVALPKPTLPRLRLYRGKVHRRIIFTEVGIALDDLRDHHKYFGALIDAARGECSDCLPQAPFSLYSQG